MSIRDSLGRPLRDVRVSVTDRCNLRCVYCMPKEVFGRDFAFLDRASLLTFEEITRLVRAFARHGAEKVRLTGGEPLLRRRIESLIEMLASIDGIHDLALTTNGALLTHEKARTLRNAGLNRVTISIDSLDDATFRAMNDADFAVEGVLRALDAATSAGLTPVKIDMVVVRGMNESSVIEVARRFRGTGHIVRFIEYMDVGNTNGWRMADVVSGAEIRAMIEREFPLVSAEPNYRGEVAQRWKYADGQGEIGIITSVTQPFCGDCTRMRVSAAGELYTCLFASTGRDARAVLRGAASDQDLDKMVASVWTARTDRYSEIRSAATEGLKKVEMSHIGG